MACFPAWAGGLAQCRSSFGGDSCREHGRGVLRPGAVEPVAQIALLGPGESGDLLTIRKMAGELGQWFANHSQSMDAALALHLRKTGYDPATGVLSMPDEIALSV